MIWFGRLRADVSRRSICPRDSKPGQLCRAFAFLHLRFPNDTRSGAAFEQIAFVEANPVRSGESGSPVLSPKR
jgi:hypothetical protein